MTSIFNRPGRIRRVMSCSRTLTQVSTRWTLGVMALLATASSLASAQSVLDPRVLEFLPAPGAVTGYQAQIAVSGTAQILQVIDLGVPAVQADGMIRTDFAGKLTAIPVPGVAYVSTIVTTG